MFLRNNTFSGHIFRSSTELHNISAYDGQCLILRKIRKLLFKPLRHTDIVRIHQSHQLIGAIFKANAARISVPLILGKTDYLELRHLLVTTNNEIQRVRHTAGQPP